MYKKVVISGYIGFDNFGDEAILSVLIDNLKSQDADITVFSKNPQKSSSLYGVKACRTFALLEVIWNIFRSDILVSGGGSLLQDTTSALSLYYYLWVIWVAKLLGKKVIVFAQGIGPIKCRVARFVTALTLRFCDYVSVRDEKSMFMLRGWGLKPDLQPDPAFNLQLPAYSPQGKVGVQLRSWKHLSPQFLDALARCVVDNFPDSEILIYSFQNELDLALCSEFEAKLILLNPRILSKVVKNTTNHSIIESFKTLDYLIAMRFHAIVLGLMYSIKTLAINYDEKVEKIAKEAHIPHINLDKENLLQYKFEELKELKSSYLKGFADSRKYDFDKLNDLLN